MTETPVGTRELVEAAVAAHKITPQQGLVYRVFGAFADRRLPAAYAGDDAQPEDNIMREVVSEWPRLSRTQQRQLRPFFIPPAAKGSWASGAASAAQSGAPGAQPVCDSNQLADRNWRSLAQPGGHVRVWWLKGEDDRVGPKARSLVAEIENHMWPRLVAVFGREPLPDGKQKCFHGIDSKVDIYMLRLPRGRALTLAYPPHCAGTPAYVVFDATYGAPDRWAVAHELTHTFQFAYRYHGSCDSYNNWDEAVANWGASYLYPRDDNEHYYPWLLRDPERSLADSSYEGWAFPYAMQQLHGTGTIRSIYDQTERLDVLQAIDAGVPGGMKKAWPEFALAAWNQDPVSPTFEEWDKFGQLPEVNGKPIAAEQLDPGAAGQVQVDVPLGGLKPLSRAYRRFKLGPGITQITVEKPSYADLSVQALVHTRDGTWKTEDWFQRQPVWCPRDAKDRPDEIILILSNNSLTQTSPGNVPLRLLATNIGCSRYTGEASGTSTYTHPERQHGGVMECHRSRLRAHPGRRHQGPALHLQPHGRLGHVEHERALERLRGEGGTGDAAGACRRLQRTARHPVDQRRTGDMGPPLLRPGVRIPRGPGDGNVSDWHVYALVRAPRKHPLDLSGRAQPSRRPARRDPCGHGDAYGHRRPDRHLELEAGARAMSARLAIAIGATKLTSLRQGAHRARPTPSAPAAAHDCAPGGTRARTRPLPSAAASPPGAGRNLRRCDAGSRGVALYRSGCYGGRR